MVVYLYVQVETKDSGNTPTQRTKEEAPEDEVAYGAGQESKKDRRWRRRQKVCT